MENNQTETCPECRGQAEGFVLMCGPKQSIQSSPLWSRHRVQVMLVERSRWLRN